MSGFQKGFVSQLLLVLLLAGGIAAGTLLVQNRTNFLPKAAGSCLEQEINNCKDEGTVNCDVVNGYNLCISGAGNFCIGDKLHTRIDFTNNKPGLTCSNSTPKCGFDKTQDLYTCISVDAFNSWRNDVANKAVAASRPAPGGCPKVFYNSTCGGKGGCFQQNNGCYRCIQTETKCSTEQEELCRRTYTDKGYKIDGCAIVGGEFKCLYPDNKNECYPFEKVEGKTCEVVKRNYNGSTYRFSEFRGGCTDGWKNYCAIVFKTGCGIDSQGVPECSSASAIETKLLQYDKAKCDGTPASGNNGTGGGAPAGGAAAPGVNKAGAPATTTATTSCKDSAGKEWPSTTKSYYKCTGNRTPCDPSGNAQVGVPFVCTNGTWSTPNNAGQCVLNSDCTASFPGISASSATGTAATSATTNTNCGTVDGLAIPCFKIGVFDEATLQATIADAKVASANYALYRKILDDLQKYVDTSTANAKTAAAQTQADACINQTFSTPATATTPKTTNSSTNSPTNATTSSDNDEPTCTNPTGCCRTFRPGKREGFPNDTCKSPQGYVYKTRPGEITTNGVKKKICELDGDPIPEDESKPKELCRENPWKK